MPLNTAWRYDEAYEQLAATYRPLFAHIAEGALIREQTRTPSTDEFALLKAAGFGTLRAPVALGGKGARLSDVFFLSAELAAADPNLAHSWRNHFSFIEDRLHARDEAGGEQLLELLARTRAVIGGGFGEKTSVPGALPGAVLTSQQDGGYLLTGDKYYCTGSLYADWTTVLARLPESTEPVVALVFVDQPGVEVVDDWDGFGQQVTGSGSVYYRHAAVDPEHILAYRQRYDYAGPFYQSFLHAVLVGIGRAIVDNLAQALAGRSRAHQHNISGVPAEDPQLLQVLGEVAALVHAAESAFVDSVRSIDAAVDEHREKRQEALDTARASVAAAQVSITENVLRAANQLFDALGASSTSTSLGLDRHWRNARTIATHNPTVARARHLGEYLITGHYPR